MKISKWLSYENRLLIILGLTFGIVSFDRNAVSILTPFIIQDFNLSNTQLGMLSSGLSLAWALSAYLIGSWSDRSGARKPFLIIAIIIFSICSVLSGFAGTFLFLLAARIVMGAAEGPFLPICLTIMNAESSPHRRGLNAGMIQSVFASLLAATIAPIVLVFFAEWLGWRMTFFLTGIPGLICAVLVWFFVREPKQADVSKKDQTEHKPALNVFNMLREHNIKICALIACFMVAWFLIGMTFLPVFFTSYRGFTPTQMSGLIAASGLSTVICGFLIPALSDRIGRKPVVIAFCFISMVTPIAALYFSGPLWMLSIFLFIGWSGTGVFPLFMAVIPGETVSAKVAASTIGLVICVGEIAGGFAAPLLAGWGADQTSLATPIIATFFCALCAGILAFFLIETAPNKVSKTVVQTN